MNDSVDMTPWPEGLPSKRPTTAEELITRVLWLEQRVHFLETKLSEQHTDFANLQKVEYRIGKLYVRDLSGTLNIGITAIGDDKTVTDLTSLESVDADEDWTSFESEAEHAWVRDSDAVWTDDDPE